MSKYLWQSWKNTVAYMGEGAIPLNREYGLIDRETLQGDWLSQSSHQGIKWHQGKAISVSHGAKRSEVTDESGRKYSARLVVDTSGHSPALIRRMPQSKPVAYQAAYGIVGKFSAPPIEPGGGGGGGANGADGLPR